MAHSVELLFDADGAAAIRDIWRMLADAALPSQQNVTAATNRPHVTLLAAQRISADVDDQLSALASALPMECVVGAPLVFTGPRPTLARLVVPSADLLALHRRVYRICEPYVAGEPFAHCRPGHWTAHVTLGRRYGPSAIGAALEVLCGLRAAELPTRLVGLRRWDGDRRVDHLLAGSAD